jgi:hypothetical protein
MKDSKEAVKGQAEEEFDCPNGDSCRFANPALEEIARQNKRPNKR